MEGSNALVVADHQALECYNEEELNEQESSDAMCVQV